MLSSSASASIGSVAGGLSSLKGVVTLAIDFEAFKAVDQTFVLSNTNFPFLGFGALGADILDGADFGGL